MKNLKYHKFLLSVFTFCLVAFPSLAQDRIYSISLKQHEIETAIRKSLTSYLGKNDYVIKVLIQGERVSEDPKTAPLATKKQIGESLPGFELDDQSALPKITDVVADSYWHIKNMRIDLIMHKEISPSVDTFIRETVPVVAEMNKARGDVFNYIPILPKTIEQAEEEVVQAEVAEGITEPKYYGFTEKELIYLAVLALAILTILFLLWRLTRIRRNIAALEEVIEQEQALEAVEQDMDPVLDLKKEREERFAKEEELLKNAILSEDNKRISQGVITQLLGRNDWVKLLCDEFASNQQAADKLAGFLAILGPNTARKLFYEVLGEEKYLDLEKISEGIVVSPTEEKEILNEIQKILFTQKLVSPEAFSFDPFSFLQELSTGQIEFLVKDEPVKIKAIVLSQLSSEDTAKILSKLAKDERSQAILQLGKIGDLPLELVEKVAYSLADKSKTIPDDHTVGVDGVEMVVDAISDSVPQVRKDLINNLRVSDRQLSDKVENRLFLFDAIPVVPKDVLTEVVRKLPSQDVMIAIADSPVPIQEKVILCFPEKIRRTLVGTVKSQKVSPEEVKEKKKLIIRGMQKMADDKKVDLKKIQADFEKMSGKKPAKSA